MRPDPISVGRRIAHKTGTGATTIGDIAMLTPPGRPPILIAAYLESPDALAHPHDDALAQAGRLALSVIAPNA